MRRTAACSARRWPTSHAHPGQARRDGGADRRRALLTYRAAWMRDEAEQRGGAPVGDVSAAAAMAKMAATENASRVIDMALQMHGGLGVKVGTKIEEPSTATSVRCASTRATTSAATDHRQIRTAGMNTVTAPSAQVDRFVHDRLPPAAQLPVFRSTGPSCNWPISSTLVEELLDKAPAKGFGDRPLLRSPQGTLSYSQAAIEVNRIAQVLTEDLGSVPGNRVLLRGGNSVAMALAWLAVVKAGLIAVATMPLLRAKELGDIIEKSQPVAALCDGPAARRAGGRTAGAPGARRPSSRLQPARRARFAVGSRGRQAAASSRPAPRRPTTSRCWPSPRAPRASRRRP